MYVERIHGNKDGIWIREKLCFCERKSAKNRIILTGLTMKMVNSESYQSIDYCTGIFIKKIIKWILKNGKNLNIKKRNHFTYKWVNEVGKTGTDPFSWLLNKSLRGRSPRKLGWDSDGIWIWGKRFVRERGSTKNRIILTWVPRKLVNLESYQSIDYCLGIFVKKIIKSI